MLREDSSEMTCSSHQEDSNSEPSRSGNASCQHTAASAGIPTMIASLHEATVVTLSLDEDRC